MDTKSNGYFFLSHSSKDIQKVRLIRNQIEKANGNPILFYLKCLDNDSPTANDEKELKSLISREIASRQKFILCKSKYTEKPLCSQWIEWEKEEVKKIAESNNNIQMYTVDLEDDTYLNTVKEIVLKQRKILLAASYEISNVTELSQYLHQKGLNTSCFQECGDMRNEVTKWFGQHTKDIIRDYLKQFNIEEKGVVITLDTAQDTSHTFIIMVKTFGSHHQNIALHFQVSKTITETEMKNIYDTIEKHIIA